MAITRSTFAVGHAQIDGRRYVTESHVWDDGRVTLREYLAPVGTDHARIAEQQARTAERTAAAETARSAYIAYEIRALERGRTVLALEGVLEPAL